MTKQELEQKLEQLERKISELILAVQAHFDGNPQPLGQLLDEATAQLKRGETIHA